MEQNTDVLSGGILLAAALIEPLFFVLLIKPRLNSPAAQARAGGAIALVCVIAGCLGLSLLFGLVSFAS